MANGNDLEQETSLKDQAEHELIETSLEVEQLDTNLFRSKRLYVPVRARGVFGGQVISQAIVSATKCVDETFGLHSLHCYFTLSASPALPILYYVECLRIGRSYSTLLVKAVQRGKVIFIMLCSFHIPEPGHPMHQWPMPQDVPPPDELELDVDWYIRMANAQGVGARMKSILLEIAEERIRSPLSIKVAVERNREDGTLAIMHWMKVRGIPKYGAAYQKCILGYMSDMNFIGVAAKTQGLQQFGRGPQAVGMTSSLDHSIFFYSDDFDCSDWLLYVIISPRSGVGRGVVHGRMYTRSGTLVAITTQEGVVRSDNQRPAAASKL